MGIIATNHWLRSYVNQNEKEPMRHHHPLDIQKKSLCDPLTPYFTDAEPEEIQQHLLNFGLFVPDREDENIINNICEGDYWKIAKKEFSHLQKEWDGPDVPVFIFPSNYRNRQLHRDFNGLAGLGFKDKLFLFITENTSLKELTAILHHEYNHVCRLHHQGVNHKNTLLDAMILEGLAEKSVEERFGKESMAKWTSIYDDDFAKKYWGRLLKQHLAVKKNDPLHDQIMYGGGPFPKWIGYNVGFRIVSSYLEIEGSSVKDILKTPSSTILDGSSFVNQSD
ncbi:uncharacterized protein YjaZ [Salirhabdus euzebyi]|uniref:Uncharacterized protein YjaZ n=1 Tax=Salirhabdus euzebyi TaxID=394506 RepID=A0A841Q5U4_9BACI|nr:DUF2268 domain-containing protein [Salirhabdus euzebyi]MBB6453755.1 uncharacterized protein YjaZ [Salirhabdus euzebyi]